MRTLRGVLLALPMIALLPGCPIYTGNHTSDPECRRDRDCSSGEVCAEGRCMPSSICTRDNDCGSNEICESRTCVPGSRTCRTHGDCTIGSYCDDGSCVPSDTCTTDGECTDGFWCDYRGTCVPRPDDACRTQADCASSTLCIEGYCRDRVETCELDRHCASGICVNNECTPTCTTDPECSAGDTCQSGLCRPANECTTSSNCNVGEHCVDGRCLPDCQTSGSTCSAGSYCATEDRFCRPDWVPTPFCDENSDCRGGRKCVDGVCRIECPTMADSQCQLIDAQLPLCRAEAGSYYCFAEIEQTPECRVQADCTGNRDCINGTCRNRS